MYMNNMILFVQWDQFILLTNMVLDKMIIYESFLQLWTVINKIMVGPIEVYLDWFIRLSSH